MNIKGLKMYQVKEKGFSFIETLLCVTIIAIIMRIPLFKIDFAENIAYKVVVDEIYQGIRQARERALASNKSIKIKRTDEGVRFIFDNEIYQEISVPSNIEVLFKNQEQTSTIRELEFSSNFSSVKAGTVYIKNINTSEQIRITIRPVSGKITLYN
ncbi:hypothetical protein AN639_03700 [Candidatus Epulonipiscium fishelsonii]|uniref:Uncharacterized protein n=1 Tax=Candidatus Epulonipiscium fishelsonii TaxID=77094 RepID=A0ACC8X6U3_9FIRM|nr:hypothetical protein AN396_12825 [Epulopiscium sp. SCG-B11WGA-EpuloA1]ONI41466.1 hypothetical protein AN639_03700 [Epulopiscium sp. SCG-B05WGA-EpuloA1]